jgi:hypothetical protein
MNMILKNIRFARKVSTTSIVTRFAIVFCVLLLVAAFILINPLDVLVLQGLLSDNHPPTAPKISIHPIEATPAEALVCSITAESSDPDADTIVYTYDWYRDADPEPYLSTTTTSTTDVLDSKSTATGKIWKCVVTPNDGTSDGESASDEIITGHSLDIITSSLPDGVLDSPYSQYINAQDGTTPYTWSIASGNLPDGLSLDTDSGLVHGTSARADTFDFTIKVTDSASDTATSELSITIQPNSDDNHKPIANAGDNQLVDAEDTIQLDGSGSSDVDGDTLSYQWSFTSRPAGSNATISNAAIVNPTFEVDVAGTYTLQLIVNDGEEDSSPDSIIITTEDLPQSMIIDHRYTELSAIPDSALSAAIAIRILVRHASVGGNINNGLDDIYDSDNKYDRSNWDFQNRGNPGWEAKVDDLVTQTSAQFETFDVFTMKLCYIDDNASWTYYRDHMEQLEADYPDKIFVWWTMPITTSGNSSRDAFNASVRSYCHANDKILFDIADIECHSPSGVKQTDGSGREIMYSGYTSDGGHLSTAGSQHVASAFWYLMARLGGWDEV